MLAGTSRRGETVAGWIVTSRYYFPEVVANTINSPELMGLMTTYRRGGPETGSRRGE